MTTLGGCARRGHVAWWLATGLLAGCNGDDGAGPSAASFTLDTELDVVPVEATGPTKVHVDYSPAGDPGPITLAVADLPAGVQASFDPPMLDGAAPAESELTLTADTSAVVGVHMVKVTGIGNSSRSEAPLDLWVTSGMHLAVGTSNTLLFPDETHYQMPHGVVVSDAAGNPPPPGLQLALTVVPHAYQKGVMQYDGRFWFPRYTIASSDPFYDSFGCRREDLDRNGELDAGEDDNGNGALDPDGAVSVPAAVTVGDDGSAQFALTYLRADALWLQVDLEVRVAGTAEGSIRHAVLPLAAEDAGDGTTAPVNVVSPYGTADLCANPE